MKYSLKENNLKNRDTEIRDCEYQINKEGCNFLLVCKNVAVR